MPRVNNIMQPIPNAYGVPGATIESAKYNSQLDDIIADANAARPITAGGTGSTSAEDARTALGVPDAATLVKKAGDRMTGSLSSAVKEHGTLGAVTEEYKFADANTHRVTVNGAHTINPTGLAEGDVMQVNVLYLSGSIAVSGTTQWELGAGAKSPNLSDIGIALTANAAYRIVFEMVAGVRTGVFQ